MTREQLETAIWQAMRDHRATIPSAVMFVDSVLAAADRYAFGDETRQLLNESLTARRRAVLAEAWVRPANPVRHWQKPGAALYTASCHGRATKAPVTTDRQLVTCGTCKQARSWREAS